MTLQELPAEADGARDASDARAASLSSSAATSRGTSPTARGERAEVAAPRPGSRSAARVCASACGGDAPRRRTVATRARRHRRAAGASAAAPTRAKRGDTRAAKPCEPLRGRRGEPRRGARSTLGRRDRARRPTRRMARRRRVMTTTARRPDARRRRVVGGLAEASHRGAHTHVRATPSAPGGSARAPLEGRARPHQHDDVGVGGANPGRAARPRPRRAPPRRARDGDVRHDAAVAANQGLPTTASRVPGESLETMLGRLRAVRVQQRLVDPRGRPRATRARRRARRARTTDGVQRGGRR